MNPEKTIKKNLLRRSAFVDNELVIHKGVPLPTWIELSLIDVCNRSCSFCPKSDENVAPDTYQKMSRTLIDKLSEELIEIKFKGAFALCGYGEPLLHKDILYVTEKLSKAGNVEIVTNGDVLTSKMMKNLYDSKASRLLISMYDGPQQIKKFKKMVIDSKVPDDFVILRDRWYDEGQNFGVKLTNRAGTINIGNQVKNIHTTCYYPSYQFLIDWNGDVFLCPQDWQRRVSMGNIMQENIFNIWIGTSFDKFRKNLLNGKRIDSPCKSCNAQGTLLGQTHASLWRKIYK
jgi:radical SAM protein with 4Fe4S-binding SPASM domain